MSDPAPPLPPVWVYLPEHESEPAPQLWTLELGRVADAPSEARVLRAHRHAHSVTATSGASPARAPAATSPASNPSGAPADLPAASSPSGAPAATPFGAPSATPSGAPAATPFGTPSATPAASSPSATPAATPFGTPFGTPSGTPAEISASSALRSALPQLLARALASAPGLPPAAPHVAHDPLGAPYLIGTRGTPLPLHLSITHSARALGLVLSARDRPGLDTEPLSRKLRADTLLRRVASTAAAERLRQLPGPVRDRELLRRWTRLEALLKATGQGFRVLAEVDVETVASGDRVTWRHRLFEVRSWEWHGQCWALAIDAPRSRSTDAWETRPG